MIRKLSALPTDTELLAGLNVNPAAIADDYCDYSRVVVKKPWGYEYLLFTNAVVAVWILYLKKDAQTSMHCHPHKKTSLVVLQGQVVCSTVTKQVDRLAGEGLMIEKGVFHQSTAKGESGAFVMEIETPVNKRDLVRLKDKYGRVAQGYESSDQHSINTQNYNYLSLNRSDIDHNLRKRFGQCTLTLRRLSHPHEMQDLLQLNPEDVICILRGSLSDHSQRSVVEVGDTVTVQDLKAANDLSANGEIELLVIKRTDSFMKVSDYIANFLEQHHVKETFLAPGESAVHLLDAIGRHEGLSFICSQGERSASLAAEGYAKSSGELGVLVVSSGGAGLNATLGVGNAWIDSVPMLVISGQTRTDQYSTGTPRQLDNKSLNIVDIVKPITKYVAKVDDPMSIRYHLEKAVFLATEGRPGPVWIDIPVDIQGATIDINELEPFVPVGSPSISKTSGTKIPEVLALLEKAKRPVILAGNGIRISKAKREFLELVSALNIPVLTSRRGADLLHEDHPLFFGRPGIYGQRRANFVIQNSDVLLSVGSRLSIPLTGRNTKTFARVAKKIVVDIDPGELNKETIIPDVALQMSAKDFICEMLRRVKTYGGEHRDWVIRCEEWACKFPPLGSDNGSTDRLMCHNVVSALADVMQENAVIVVDGGSPVHSMMQSFMFKSKQRLISSTGLELPGFALAGAIGVSISRGRSPVLCLCEDRGFHVSVPELQTIMDYKLPIKMFIFKTDGNSNIRKLQRDYFGERYVGTDREMLWGSPAIANIANAYGVYAFKINHLEHLSAHLGRVIDYPGPVICEVQVEDDQDIRPRVGFTIKDEGRWVPKPLEDMHPYLNRDTLKENMLIGLVDED